MKVAVMTDIMEMEMMERPKPEVKDNEVMVKVKHCGVCGSDVHFYEQGRIGGFIVEPPFVLGHECAGEVVEIGSAVKKFKVGDLVAIEPGRVCNTCEACKSGRYNLCPEMEFYATPPCDGAFAEFVTAPEDMTYMLPEGMSTLEGALLEPLAVGFQAVTRGKATVGQSAVVLGSGCIGLCTMMALHARGVNTVYMVDVIPMRLEMAKKLGAAGVVNAKEENTIEAIKKLTNGQGVDMVYETAGTQLTQQQSVSIVKPGGTIVLVGFTPDDAGPTPFDFGTLIMSEITIATSWRYCNQYPAAIDALKNCKLPLKEIVTDVFPFEKTREALDYNVNHKQDTVKVVLEI